MSKSAASSLISVVDEMEKAVRSQRPKSQVLVDGGNQLLDIGNVSCLYLSLLIVATFLKPEDKP